MKTLQFTIEAPAAFLNVNDRPHYHLKAKLTKAWREATAAHAATYATMNLRTPVRIVAHIHKPGNRRWDPNNLSSTTKACVDGMVDAGLFPDDSWKEVIGPDHRRGDSLPNAITFTITEATE